MSYYCMRCKKKHVRGAIFEQHAIYKEEFCLEITEEMKRNPWTENCFDCKYHDNYFGIHQCLLIQEDFERYGFELSAMSKARTLEMPKACYRVPRTSVLYRKCKYWVHQERLIKKECKTMEV